MSIAKLKRQREELESKLKKSVETEGKGGGAAKDDRLWKPTADKEKGTGYAKVRFLPAVDGEDLPYVKTIDHGFKGPSGKWYFENSRWTIGQADPVRDLNGRLWNSGIEADRKFVQAHTKQRKNFYANVLVLEDPKDPSAVGKVKLYRFGPRILQYIEDKLYPKFEDDKAANPFDMWTGCDLIIKMHVANDQWSYDKTKWSDASELFPGDDDQKDKIWAQCHPLKPFIDPKNFKSYADLQKKLVEVLGPVVGSGIKTAENAAQTKAEQDDDAPFEADKPAPSKVETTKAALKEAVAASVTKAVEPDEDDDFFAKLKEDAQ